MKLPRTGQKIFLAAFLTSLAIVYLHWNPPTISSSQWDSIANGSKQNVCICANGTAATGVACTMMSAAICISCISGFVLRDNACEAVSKASSLLWPTTPTDFPTSTSVPSNHYALDTEAKADLSAPSNTTATREIGNQAITASTTTTLRNSVKLKGSRPNFIIFNADDVGWADFSFNNPDADDTPRLQALGDAGMTLSNFHAGASVCTPSRASLMTGRFGLRTGVTGLFEPYHSVGLPLSEMTLAEMLRSAGYRTAMYGKWHLGHHPPYGPIHRGFDVFKGTPLSHDYGCTDQPLYNIGCPKMRNDVCEPPDGLDAADGSKCPQGPHNRWHLAISLHDGDEIIEQPVADLRFLAQRFAAWADEFIHNHTRMEPDRPFFLYMAWHHMHAPVGNHDPKFTNTSKRGVYGDSLRQLDESVGAVVDAVASAGVKDNTLIFFTGDNGPADNQLEFGGKSDPYIGKWARDHIGGATGKTTTWEGGHRMPGLAVWPGKIAAGTRSAALTSQLDYFPTLAVLAGATLPADRVFDGLDLGPVLFDGESSVRSVLMYPNSGEGPPGQFDTLVVDSSMKLKFRTWDKKFREPLMFDLVADPAESNALTEEDHRYKRAWRTAAMALKRMEMSLARDKRSHVSWKKDLNVQPCCNKADRLCRCQSKTVTTRSTLN